MLPAIYNEERNVPEFALPVLNRITVEEGQCRFVEMHEL
jgi:hypothetical protein